jgi:hypothetical protein
MLRRSPAPGDVVVNFGPLLWVAVRARRQTLEHLVGAGLLGTVLT